MADERGFASFAQLKAHFEKEPMETGPLGSVRIQLQVRLAGRIAC